VSAAASPSERDPRALAAINTVVISTATTTLTASCFRLAKVTLAGSTRQPTTASAASPEAAAGNY
jgi:hypothetical protein